jgi:hypothetical protein
MARPDLVVLFRDSGERRGRVAREQLHFEGLLLVEASAEQTVDRRL